MNIIRILIIVIIIVIIIIIIIFAWSYQTFLGKAAVNQLAGEPTETHLFRDKTTIAVSIPNAFFEGNVGVTSTCCEVFPHTDLLTPVEFAPVVAPLPV